MAGKMTNEQYQATQDLLINIAHQIQILDLVGFLNRIEQADTWGMMRDPTLYRATMKNLQDIRDLAAAALQFQRTVMRLKGGE